jgi:hypothetical protein
MGILRLPFAVCRLPFAGCPRDRAATGALRSAKSELTQRACDVPVPLPCREGQRLAFAAPMTIATLAAGVAAAD